MKIFWPRRSDAKGFSIEKFASKYHENISILDSNKISNQFLDDRALKTTKEDSKLDKSHLYNRKGHWANRDFSEYRDAA